MPQDKGHTQAVQAQIRHLLTVRVITGYTVCIQFIANLKLLIPSGFYCWFYLAPVFQWPCVKHQMSQRVIAVES